MRTPNAEMRLRRNTISLPFFHFGSKSEKVPENSEHFLALRQPSIAKIQVSDLLSGLWIIDQDLHINLSVVNIIQLIFFQILSYAQKVIFFQ